VNTLVNELQNLQTRNGDTSQVLTPKKPSTVPAAATSTTTPPAPNPRQLTDVTISSYPVGTSISTGADLGEHRLGPVTVARLPLPRPDGVMLVRVARPNTPCGHDQARLRISQP
jgi:hypothetical protein